MSRIEINTSTGVINGWVCSVCKLYNDILSFYCGQPIIDLPGRCIGHRDLDLGLTSSRIRLERSGETNCMSLSEKEQKELHTEFFNKGLSMAVSTATIEELDTKLDSLARIAFEAKCLVQGVAEGKRQRVAKLTKEERDKLITKPDLTTSDAFQSVKKRADRMSQADKLVETYRKLGMSDEEIQSMLGNIKIKESQQSVASQTSKPIERIVEKQPKEVPDVAIPSNGTAKLLIKETPVVWTAENQSQAEARMDRTESNLIEAKQELAEITQPEAKPEVPEVPSFLKGLFGR